VQCGLCPLAGSGRARRGDALVRQSRSGRGLRRSAPGCASDRGDAQGCACCESSCRTRVWGYHCLGRGRKLEEVLAKRGAVFIHPSNDPYVIAGQGTAALELLDEVADLDVVMVPVGGGGLLAGTALAVKGLLPDARVYGAEPVMVDDAARSLHDGRIHLPTGAYTVADGLRTFLGDVNFPIIQAGVHDIVTVTEQGIIRAMRLVWERMKLIIEPSAAVPVAALFEHREVFQGKRVGVILSGGNVNLDELPWLA